jgi:hypothetical protein
MDSWDARALEHPPTSTYLEPSEPPSISHDVPKRQEPSQGQQQDVLTDTILNNLKLQMSCISNTSDSHTLCTLLKVLMVVIHKGGFSSNFFLPVDNQAYDVERVSTFLSSAEVVQKLTQLLSNASTSVLTQACSLLQNLSYHNGKRKREFSSYWCR